MPQLRTPLVRVRIDVRWEYRFAHDNGLRIKGREYRDYTDLKFDFAVIQQVPLVGPLLGGLPFVGGLLGGGGGQGEQGQQGGGLSI